LSAAWIAALAVGPTTTGTGGVAEGSKRVGEGDKKVAICPSMSVLY
jgi:hypothetical protein